MPQWLVLFGVLAISYILSRAIFVVIPATRSRRWRICVAHLGAFATIQIVLTLFKGYSSDAATQYALGQMFWFVVDMARDFRPRSGRKVRNLLRSPEASNLIAASVGIASVYYVGFGFLAFTQSASGYQKIPPRATPEEVRYALSSPIFVRAGPTERWQKEIAPEVSADWLYSDPEIRVIFDRPGGRVRDIVCRQSLDAATGPCPSVFGLSTGSTEENLIRALGAPSRVTVDAKGRKTMGYPELGHDFLLEQFRITAIRIYDGDGDKMRKLGRFLIWLIP